jgi:hypothetical protein
MTEDFLAPAKPGEEPKSIQLVKSITWIAVLLLVATEIVVSIKVGGSPFDVTRAVVPVVE